MSSPFGSSSSTDERESNSSNDGGEYDVTYDLVTSSFSTSAPISDRRMDYGVDYLMDDGGGVECSLPTTGVSGYQTLATIDEGGESDEETDVSTEDRNTSSSVVTAIGIHSSEAIALESGILVSAADVVVTADVGSPEKDLQPQMEDEEETTRFNGDEPAASLPFETNVSAEPSAEIPEMEVKMLTDSTTGNQPLKITSDDQTSTLIANNQTSTLIADNQQLPITDDNLSTVIDDNLILSVSSDNHLSLVSSTKQSLPTPVENCINNNLNDVTEGGEEVRSVDESGKWMFSVDTNTNSVIHIPPAQEEAETVKAADSGRQGGCTSADE